MSRPSSVNTFLKKSMTKVEWFRRTSWSDLAALEFATHLRRSRTLLHKAQYLKIQACTLLETDEPLLVAPALQLLNQLFDEFPDKSQLEHAHLLAARCLEHQGDPAGAMRQLQLALEAHLGYPNSDAGTTLQYPWFIVQHCIEHLYDNALTCLNTARLTFPVQLFKAATIRALVAESRNDPEVAGQYARDALAVAAQTKSPFRHHQSLGLVDDSFASILERLRRISAFI